MGKCKPDRMQSLSRRLQHIGFEVAGSILSLPAEREAAYLALVPDLIALSSIQLDLQQLNPGPR